MKSPEGRKGISGRKTDEENTHRVFRDLREQSVKVEGGCGQSLEKTPFACGGPEWEELGTSD